MRSVDLDPVESFDPRLGWSTWKVGRHDVQTDGAAFYVYSNASGRRVPNYTGTAQRAIAAVQAALAQRELERETVPDGFHLADRRFG